MTGSKKTGGLAAGLKSAQSAIWLVGGFITVIATASVGYVKIIDRLDENQRHLSRHSEILAYQLRNDAWQTDAIEHMINSHPGLPPQRPDELRVGLLELLSR